MNKRAKIAIIAGETSGEIIGSKLMKALKNQYNGEIDFIGIGGEEMQKLGLNSLFPLKYISVMGFFEVLPHLRKIYLLLKKTVNYIKSERPDILITIDAPGFNFRVAKSLKGQNIKLVHYVAPSVWAYKAHRAKKFAEIYDLLLTLWPFEPDYFRNHGLNTYFIGNSFLEDLPRVNRDEFRYLNNIGTSTSLICMMPGSRKSEINKILPCFSASLKILHHKMYDMVVVIPVASSDLAQYIKDKIKNVPYRVIIAEGNENKRAIFAASDLALIKSGTSAIEVASSLTPMVIGYIANPFSILIAKMMIKVKHINIINIIRNRQIIPEFIQSNCRPDYLANALYDLHINREKAKYQMDESIKLLKEVGLHFDPTPSSQAAKHILNLLN